MGAMTEIQWISIFIRALSGLIVFLILDAILVDIFVSQMTRIFYLMHIFYKSAGIFQTESGFVHQRSSDDS